MSFLKAHAKALVAFGSAEAATMITALQNPHAGVREFVIAALLPLAVGGAVRQTTNGPTMKETP